MTVQGVSGKAAGESVFAGLVCREGERRFFIAHALKVLGDDRPFEIRLPYLNFIYLRFSITIGLCGTHPD